MELTENLNWNAENGIIGSQNGPLTCKYTTHLKVSPELDLNDGNGLLVFACQALLLGSLSEHGCYN